MDLYGEEHLQKEGSSFITLTLYKATSPSVTALPQPLLPYLMCHLVIGLFKILYQFPAAQSLPYSFFLFFFFSCHVSLRGTVLVFWRRHSGLANRKSSGPHMPAFTRTSLPLSDHTLKLSVRCHLQKFHLLVLKTKEMG